MSLRWSRLRGMVAYQKEKPATGDYGKLPADAFFAFRPTMEIESKFIVAEQDDAAF